MTEPCTALLIEDEAQVLQIVRRMLDPEVCHVVPVSDAEAGLRIIERDDPPVDLVVTDLRMPGLNGLDVVDVLQRYRPDLPALIISADAGSISPIVLHTGRCRVLQKPFSIDAIQQLVSDLLAQAEHPGGLSAARSRHARLDLVNAAWVIHRGRRG